MEFLTTELADSYLNKHSSLKNDLMFLGVAEIFCYSPLLLSRSYVCAGCLLPVAQNCLKPLSILECWTSILLLQVKS